MKSVVAYPDEYRNDSLIEKHYDSLEMSPDQYLQNVLNINHFNMKYQISKLREPVDDKNDWKNVRYAKIFGYFYNEINYNTISNEMS